jgi:hypothetical protein
MWVETTGCERGWVSEEVMETSSTWGKFDITKGDALSGHVSLEAHVVSSCCGALEDVVKMSSMRRKVSS